MADLGPHALRQGRSDANHAGRARCRSRTLPPGGGRPLVKAAELEALLKGALERAGEPEADAYASLARRGFARFFGGEIGQHMDIEEPVAVLRMARGKRVA